VTLPRFERHEYNVDLEHCLVWHVLGFFSIEEDGTATLRRDCCRSEDEREHLRQGAQIAVESCSKDTRCSSL